MIAVSDWRRSNGFRPGPIEDAVAHLERHGIEIEHGPAETTSTVARGRHVYVRDADGSLLELVSHAASWASRSGSVENDRS